MDCSYDTFRVSHLGSWYGIGHLHPTLVSHFFPVTSPDAPLVFPELVTGGNPRHLDFSQPQLWVALPTFLFALKTKSLGGTVVVGMLLFWMVGKLL
jgi:branched-subunit amino acid transport protein